MFGHVWLAVGSTCVAIEFPICYKAGAVAKQLGCLSVEVIDKAEWWILQKHGLLCPRSLNGRPGAPFVMEFNNPRSREEPITHTKQAIDDRPEINYPAIMHKLLALGYDGYVNQEYLPTRDPLVGLTEAVQRCDV